jgi:hypothetical protein
VLVKLREDPFSKGCIDCFKVYLKEPREYSVLIVSVSKGSFDSAEREKRKRAGEFGVKRRLAARGAG